MKFLIRWIWLSWLLVPMACGLIYLFDFVLGPMIGEPFAILCTLPIPPVTTWIFRRLRDRRAELLATATQRLLGIETPGLDLANAHAIHAQALSILRANGLSNQNPSGGGFVRSGQGLVMRVGPNSAPVNNTGGGGGAGGGGIVYVWQAAPVVKTWTCRTCGYLNASESHVCTHCFVMRLRAAHGPSKP